MNRTCVVLAPPGLLATTGGRHIDVMDSTGKIPNWAVETGGAKALIRRGLKKTDVPAGRNFFVEGSSGTGTPGDTTPRQ